MRFVLVRFGRVGYGLVRLVFFAISRRGLVRLGTVRLGLVRHGSVWSGRVRFGLIY